MKRLARVALPLMMLLGMASGVRAQVRGPAPVPFLRASMASCDALDKLAADLGIEIPAEYQPKTFFEAKTFIGPGSLATNRPLGIVLFANDAQPGIMTLLNGLTFAVPVAEGKLTPENMAQLAKAVEGQPDTYTVGNTTLRRNGSYLFYQPSAGAGIQDLQDTVLLNDYRQPGNLAVMSLDLAALRKAPRVYKSIMDAWGSAPGSSAEGVQTLQSGLDKLDRILLALGQDEKNMHFKSWLVSPTLFPSKPAKQASRPGFPAGTLMQVHIVYPDSETAGWVERMIDTLPAGSLGKMNPDQETKAKALAKRAAKLFVGGDAASVALGMKNQKLVVYLVNQMAQDVDFAAEAKDISEATTALAKEVGLTYEQSVAPYTSNGKSVTRWTIGAGASKWYVDCLQVGKQLWFTITQDDGKYVDEFANLPSAGTSSILCAGAIDLGAIGKAFPEAAMPPDLVAGQGITWAAQLAEQGDYLYVDLSVPTKVVKAAPKIFQGAMGMMMGGMGGPGGMPPGAMPGSMPGGGMMPMPPGSMPGGGMMPMPMPAGTTPATVPGGGN